jgi:hypothetical protein
MAKTRVVNTRFWVDDYTSNLDPIEKLLFLYFLTNPATEICGIYELPLKTVALDTGIDKDMVERILKRFAKDKKIYYSNGWVAIQNFVKHQSVNPTVLIGIKRGLENAPKDLKNKVGIDDDGSLSEPIHSLSHSNLYLNSNLNLNLTKESEAKAPLEFVWEDHLEKMLKDKNLHIQVIAFYLKTRGKTFETLAQVQTAIKRHAKAARELAVFPKPEIGKAIRKLQYEFPKFTLETVLKELTK